MWHGWRVYGETLDLCASTSCPIRQGPVTITNQHKLPGIAPAGAYSIRLEATGAGEGGQQLMCLDMQFDIRGGPAAWAKRWIKWPHPA